MADNKTSEQGLNQMFDMWKEGQETFFKAQNEAMQSFAQSLNNVGESANAKLDIDPVAAWNSFIKSWAPDWDPSKFAATGDEAAEAFKKNGFAFYNLLDPANWTQYAPEQLRIILQSIANGPRFADLATPQNDAAESWRETLDYQQAATDMAKVMQDAWGKAYSRFSENHSVNDLQSGNVEGALDAWLKAANTELLDVQRSDPFMDAQKRMIRASTEIKARQKDLAEAWSEAYQMPTRTEVDDLTRTVHELRRELRKLKRELANLKATD